MLQRNIFNLAKLTIMKESGHIFCIQNKNDLCARNLQRAYFISTTPKYLQREIK